MNRADKPLMVINDGAKIRPDWTDRISVCLFPNTTKLAVWESEIDVVSEHTDLSGATYNITPITFCRRAWESRDVDGNLVLTELFSDFDAPSPARYSLEANGNLMIDLAELNVFKGGFVTKNLAYRYDGTTWGSRRDSGVELTVNPDFAGWTALGRATVDFTHNNYYVQGATEAILGNLEGLICYDDNIMHNVDTNHTKFFIYELGCYTLGSKYTVTTEEFDDWFLPSVGELEQMKANLYGSSVGDFVDGAGYWSSSEGTTSPATEAWVVFMGLMGVTQEVAKDTLYYVRPIRTFTSSEVFALRDEGEAGGLIFYVVDNMNGTYTYYEAAPNDLGYESGSTYIWSNIDDAQATTGDAIGDGFTNTNAIISQEGHIASAAYFCYVFEFIVETGTYEAINYQDLTSDFTIRKSEICGLQKVISDRKYYVELSYGKKALTIAMGEVWNKPEWTNDVAGMDLAYNEISEWLI